MGSNPKFKAKPGARPALQALKERERSASVLELDEDSQKTEKPGDSNGFSRIFAKSANALVPGQPGFAGKNTKTGDDPFRLAETVVDPKTKVRSSRRPPSLENISEATTQISPRPTDPVPAPKYKKRDRVVSPVLLFIVVAAIASVLFSSNFRRLLFPPDPLAVTDADRMKWSESIQRHLDKTGSKLNRERIQTEYENALADRDVGYGTKKEKDPDIMKGLPLEPEANANADLRKRDVLVNPVYPDSRTEIALAEEKAIRDWEQQANKTYLDEFVANAAKAGYAVKVGPDGVARVIGRVPIRPAGPKFDDRLPEDAAPGRDGSSR